MRLQQRFLLVFVVVVAVALALTGAVAAQEDDVEESPQPFLGVRVMENENGAEVARVVPNSAASDAGLQRGDIISAVDGEAVTADSLSAVIAGYAAGDTVALTVERDGETLEVEATLGEAPPRRAGGRDFDMPRGERGEEMPFGFGFPGMRMNLDQGWLGVRFVTLDETTAAEYEVETTEGALILDVQDESPAAEAGLMESDIITAVDGDIVDFERTLADRIAAYEADDTVTLTVLRDGESQEIEVILGELEIERRFFGPEGFEFPRPDMPPVPMPPVEETPEPSL